MSTTQERFDRELLNACRYGHVSEVDILLSKGANIHYSDEDDPFGATCLSEASRRGKSEIVELLLKRGVTVNDKISHDITGLHLACERGHLNVVRVYLANKCDPCPAELFNLDTPLHYAAANDHAEICKILVEQGGVDVNIQNRTGDTPLHIAVANDRLKSTTMLLTLNGDLSITNHAEMTPIIVAQIAKCKHAIEAMQPFLNKLAEKEEKEKEIKKEKLNKSRKNTIKQTLEQPFGAKVSNDSTLNEQQFEELKYHSDYGSDDDGLGDRNNSHRNDGIDYFMSGKRNVVFKKGFLEKQGKKFKHFHERYFILWSNGVMNYYAKEHTLFANYQEKSKSPTASSSTKPTAIDTNLTPSNSLHQSQSGQGSPVKSSTSPCDENENTIANVMDADLYSSGDDDDDAKNNKKSPKSSNKNKKRSIKRKSTLYKLGLKSDSIKPKGVIDINDLIETQFLEFNDNSPGWALITNEREWKFKCKNDRERREWIGAVHAVNYGISPFDFQNLGMNISYKDNTMLLEPAQNSFLSHKNQQMNDATSNAIAQGWMFKLGAAVRGLEQNYWKKRWVSLYKKPARLTYALHPYDVHNNNEDDAQSPTHLNPSSNGKIKKKKTSILKGTIQLNDVTNIIKIGNNDIIKNKYRAPTVHVFALITNKRTWVFACKTAEECNMWYDRISFFLPNQWKNDNSNVNVEELLRFNRVKTMAHENDNNDSDDDGRLNVNKKNKKKKKKSSTDETMMSKIFRKVSTVAETLGITEQYSTISGVQPKGTITDYDDAVNMVQNIDSNNNNTNMNGNH